MGRTLGIRVCDIRIISFGSHKLKSCPFVIPKELRRLFSVYASYTFPGCTKIFHASWYAPVSGGLRAMLPYGGCIGTGIGTDRGRVPGIGSADVGYEYPEGVEGGGLIIFPKYIQSQANMSRVILFIFHTIYTLVNL